MARKKRSRLYLTIGALVLIGAAMAAAFWPRAVMVDMGQVARGAMTVTIDEEGRTRVREAYVVSTPVAGRLQRVEVNPGDPVTRGETVVAHMRPINPTALDIRTREQARAAVDAAEAALRVARADLNAAIASNDLAKSELARTEQLASRGIATDAALDRSKQEARVAQANVDTAEAAISMRQAEVTNAQAQLIGFDDQGLAAALGPRSDDIPITAPASGRILRIMQQSETTLPAGTPIMEIGDVGGDLHLDPRPQHLDHHLAAVVQGGLAVFADEPKPVDTLGNQVLEELLDRGLVAIEIELTDELGHGIVGGNGRWRLWGLGREQSRAEQSGGRHGHGAAGREFVEKAHRDSFLCQLAPAGEV